MNIPLAYHNKHHMIYSIQRDESLTLHIPKKPMAYGTFLWAFKFSVYKHAQWFHCCVSKVTPSFQMLNFMYALDYNAYSHFQRTRSSQKIPITSYIVSIPQLCNLYQMSLPLVLEIATIEEKLDSVSLERCCQRHNFPNLTGLQEYVTKST